jgi:hypothetical protein
MTLSAKNLTLFFFLWGALLSCQSAPEEVSRSGWADVTLTATGVGPIKEWSPSERVRGIQQAKIDAGRKLEEQILALITDSGKPFSEKMNADEMKRLSAYVRGAEVVAIYNRPEGVEIQARLLLGDPFKAALGLLKRKELSAPQNGKEGSF